MTKHKAIFFAIVSNAIFGLSFIFSKMALDITSPIIMVSVRFFTAFVLMTAIRPFLKHKLNYKGKKIWRLFLLGLVQPVAYFLCESYGLKHSTSSFAGAILATLPIFAMIIASVFLGERTTLLQKICVFGSVLGVAITSVGKSEGTSTLLGFLLLMGATIAGSLCNVLLRKFSEDFTPFEQNYVMFGFGAVVFTAIAIVQNRSDLLAAYLVPLSSGKFWISIAYLAGLSSIGAFLLITTSLTHMPASLVAPLTSITTVVSILAGVVLLRENFTLLQGIGSAIIVASTFLISLSVSEKKQDPQTAPQQ